MERELIDKIQDLISIYANLCEVLEMDMSYEDKFCNSYRKGKYSAYHEFIDELNNLIEEV